LAPRHRRSWTALFLAHGLAVVVNDPTRRRDDRPQLYPNNLSTLKKLGLPTDNLEKKLSFEADLERSVAGADLVQENGPEADQFKQDLWVADRQGSWESTHYAFVELAKTATEQALMMSRPERLLVGHPFNPPHLIPLVEVVPVRRPVRKRWTTRLRSMLRSARCRAWCARKCLVLLRNRLQRAIFRECCYLVIQGVVQSR